MKFAFNLEPRCQENKATVPASPHYFRCLGLVKKTGRVSEDLKEFKRLKSVSPLSLFSMFVR